jgi:hypothetical protein
MNRTRQQNCDEGKRDMVESKIRVDESNEDSFATWMASTLNLLRGKDMITEKDMLQVIFSLLCFPSCFTFPRMLC